MTEREVLISVEGVSKVYRMGEVEVHALRDAHLDVYDGEFLVVVGPSGSGKSTLLNLIGGMDRPTSGVIRFEGREISGFSERDLTRYRRTQVGFIFQFFNLIATLTARENVEVATELAGEGIDAIEALKKVGLSGRADHFPSQLSGGEQQRVAIARALASDPRLLLCDEPTGAVDSETGVGVLETLIELSRGLGKTVVLITHNSAIAKVADRVASIHDGTIAHVRRNETPAQASEVRW